MGSKGAKSIFIKHCFINKNKMRGKTLFPLINIYLYLFQVNKYTIKTIFVKTYSPVTSLIKIRYTRGQDLFFVKHTLLHM
jgi:hypothetical protein